MQSNRLPALFIPHGGGPCFFMDDPQGMWNGMESYLAGISGELPEPPKAIIVISGHWETDGFCLTTSTQPPLIYDYYGFPPHTYEIRYPAPGEPDLAAKAASLLRAAGLQCGLDTERGLDHGVFIPMKVAFPEAAIPVVEMSLDRSLDPALHLAAGRALSPLRDEGVLIVGSGMSFHNMRAYRNPTSTAQSQMFDEWLADAASRPAAERSAMLKEWASAPEARFAHPREEHLLPLMVVAGASDAAGERTYSETVMETAISGFRFA